MVHRPPLQLSCARLQGTTPVVSTPYLDLGPRQASLLNMVVGILLLLLVANLDHVRAQEKPRLGKDGRPLLNKPKVRLLLPEVVIPTAP